MDVARTAGALAASLVIAACAVADVPLASAARVLPSSIELDRRIEPWCPGDCRVAGPFVAEYRRGKEHLVFVGAFHAFQPEKPTMHAVAASYAQARPKILIAESFPTAMGESPAMIAEQARQYGSPGNDEFMRSETMYAMSLALKHGVPFVGGEPTRAVQVEAVKAAGASDEDLAFGSVSGLYSQALRSGDMPDLSLDSLRAYYPTIVDIFRLPVNHGGRDADAPPLDKFLRDYRELYGVELVGDTGFPMRIDVVFDQSRQGLFSRVAAKVRDRHLLALVEQQLVARQSVLVVYGGSHWATLSAALEARLGKPVVKPFVD